MIRTTDCHRRTKSLLFLLISRDTWGEDVGSATRLNFGSDKRRADVDILLLIADVLGGARLREAEVEEDHLDYVIDCVEV